jgi:hypothetical protein
MTEPVADPFPTTPQLRLSPEAHTAAIRRIDCDAAGRWLVSGSHDKTVKVWRIADGALVRTLRVPLGAGDLGKVYAVAISPDGARVAAGGWTGSADGLDCTIYISDRATGELLRTLGGLPNVVQHLAWSPDGARLAATLGRGKGLRVYDTADWREQARDTDYGAAAYGADFAADGRLVTSCYDGKVRLYAADVAGARARPLRTCEPPGGKRPFTLAFAPDGGRIAVGFHDSTRVDLLDGRTLKPIAAADTAGVDNGDLSKVAWSADGQRLLAGGRFDIGGSRPVRRWQQAGLGRHDDTLRPARDTIMALRPLPDGALAVGAQDGLALLNADDTERWRRPNAAADFRGQRHGQGLRLSADGARIAFGYEEWGERPALFALPALSLTLAPFDDDLAGLNLPDEGPRPDLAVTDWVNEVQPRCNGRPLALKRFETARALALLPGGAGFVLGADWSLRAFDAAGEPRWQQPVPGTAWAVNASADGRWVVAGYADGTLRWHRAGDGAEVLALYPHPDGRRWVAWTPLGHYAASAGGDDLIAWHLNRGPDQAPQVFGASRFREGFERPDLIARVLEAGDPAAALAAADAARSAATGSAAPATPAAAAASIPAALPPTLTLLAPPPGTPVDSQRLALFYRAESGTGPVTDILARLDGRPVEVLHHAVGSRSDDGAVQVGQVTLCIAPQDGTAELIGVNRHGAGEPVRFDVQWGGGADSYKPRLFVLAVGVGAYAKADPLAYAAGDAEAVAAELARQQGGLYRQVQVQRLIDAQASRVALLDGLDWLEREVDARDVAMVFLAGHGVRTPAGEYCFLTPDSEPLRPHRDALSDADLRRSLSAFRGKTVLFIDSCHAGAFRPVGARMAAALPDIDRLANELADAERGVVVFSASTGRQTAHEDPAWGHGAFTAALLEAVRDGHADFTQNDHVTVSELDVYIAERVRTLTAGRQQPTMTKPDAVPNFPIFRVLGEGTTR